MNKDIVLLDELSNGIKFWQLPIQPRSLKDFFYFSLLIDVGHRDNPTGKDGLVHLTEHQICSAMGLDGQQIDRKFQIFGCCRDVGCSYWYTYIEARLSKTKYKMMLPYLKAMIEAPDLGVGLKQEKKVVLHEVAGKNGPPLMQQKIMEFYGRNFSSGLCRLISPAKAPGTSKTIGSISQIDVDQIWEKFFRNGIGNAVALGAFDNNYLAGWLNDLPAYKKPKRNRLQVIYKGSMDKEVLISCNDDCRTSGENNSLVNFVAFMPHHPGHRFRAIETILENILTDLISKKLRSQRGWIYNSEINRRCLGDILEFHIQFHINPKNRDKAADLIAGALSRPFSRRQFQEEKSKQLGELYFHDDNLYSVFDLACGQLNHNGRIITAQQRLSILEELDYEEFERFWEEYLMDRFLTIKVII